MYKRKCFDKINIKTKEDLLFFIDVLVKGHINNKGPFISSHRIVEILETIFDLEEINFSVLLHFSPHENLKQSFYDLLEIIDNDNKRIKIHLD